MKKTVAFFLSLVMVFTCISALAFNVIAEEEPAADPMPGTAEYEQKLLAEGYQAIESFAEVTNYSATGKYYLTKDIVFVDKGHTNADLLRSENFEGILDGNGHTIYNLQYSLFKTLKGTIKNLIFSKYTDAEEIDGFKVKEQLISNIGDGAVMENITTNRVFIDDIDNYWGTIVREVPANATVTFKKVINNSSIAFPWTAYNIKIGGFIGLANKGSTLIFEDCVNAGNVKGSQAGGFIAVLMGNNTVSFKNCENKGTVTGSIGKANSGEAAYGIAGGFIGSYNNAQKRDTTLNISFENCVNTGDVIRWGDQFWAVSKEHKVAQGGFIGNIGEGSNNNAITLSFKNCTIANCQVGATTVWQDKLDEGTGKVIDYTQGYVGSLAGWLGLGDNDTVTVENCLVRNVEIECADPDFATLFLNTGSNNLRAVVLKDSFAVACNEIRAATGNVRFQYTGTAATSVSVNKTQGSAVENEKTSLRFLGGIDSLNYLGVGFVVEAKEGDSRSYYFLYNKKAYNEVNNGAGKLTKADFDGKYITAAVLEDVSAAGTITYKVTPYAMDLENNAIVGTAKSITLTAGKLS